MRRFDVYVPGNLGDMLRFLHTAPNDTALIARGTDLLPRILRGQLRPRLLADLSGLEELHAVTLVDGVVHVGAMTTIAELAENEHLRDYEIFQKVKEKFGGPSIINMATVGGNVASATSSEDLIPTFLALDARVQLQSIRGERTLRVEEFLRGKRKTALEKDEIVKEIAFNALNSGSWATFEKIGRRNSLIIALVSIAVYLELAPDSKKIESVRIALNRVRGKVPERARDTENLLLGKSWTASLAKDAATTLHRELALTSDYRASGEYRLAMAQILLRRALNHCAKMILAGA